VDRTAIVIMNSIYNKVLNAFYDYVIRSLAKK